MKGKVKSRNGLELQVREEDGLLCDGLVIFLGTYFGTYFRGQQIIVRFTVDFYCHKAALVIGLDGNVLKGVEQKEGDSKCDKALNELRLKIVRFKNDEVLRICHKWLGKLRNRFGHDKRNSPGYGDWSKMRTQITYIIWFRF